MINTQCSKFLQIDMCLDGINALIIYGNDHLFLDTFVDICICKHNQVQKISKKQTDTHEFSDFHFTFDFSSEHFRENINTIKSLAKTRSISGKPHIIHIKKVNKSKCKLLHGLIDNNNGNIIFIITTQKLMDIDDRLNSRSFKMNLSFPKQNIIKFCENELPFEYNTSIFEDVFSLSRGNLISVILRLECENNVQFENIIYDFLDTLKNSKSFLTAISNTRNIVYKLYHMNIQFPYVCNLIIHKYKDSSSKSQRIIECCANYDHMMNTAYKDIFVYERFFLDILEIIKEKDVPVKKGRKKLLKRYTVYCI